MTPPLTPRPDHLLEPTAAAKTTSTQLFGVLYITLTGLVDSVVPNSGPWSLLGRSVSYIIKLAPILWWALPTGLAAPHPEPPNASTYDWLPDNTSLRKAARKRPFSRAGLLAVPLHSPPFGNSFFLCLPASGGNSPALHYISAMLSK
ncbi:hypothetical protein DSO57_1004520 [Entomophthora muscae]|uniref:Uncharacterized protein n=1 Tax=Entomophthora muscae TaxID=34485 RepID=A0ACC2RMX4_9FUNG|nr:hypothetical protein DSO57_1004520 [Entomophthora muscae]